MVLCNRGIFFCNDMKLISLLIGLDRWLSTGIIRIVHCVQPTREDLARWLNALPREQRPRPVHVHPALQQNAAATANTRRCASGCRIRLRMHPHASDDVRPAFLPLPLYVYRDIT